MAVSDNERYLRYLLLLGEGSLLVLRGILLKEVARRNQPLHDILANNRTLLSSKVTDPRHYMHIFPTTSSVNDDITTWDMSLLAMVIVHVFGDTIGQRDVNSVKEIHDKRAHIYENESNSSLGETEYCQKRLSLSLTLLNLAAETDFNTHYMTLEVVSASGAKPYSTNSLLQKLTQLREFPSEMMDMLYEQLDVVLQKEDYSIANSNEETVGVGSLTRNRLSDKMSDLHCQSWYFGPLSRDETNAIFDHVHTDGVFLVRDCQSNPGNLVLSVKEGGKLSQYIICRVFEEGSHKFHIGEGDKTFESLADIIDFYTTHYLNKTALTTPAPRQKYVTKSDFPGNNPKDLPFKKGEILEIISKEEERWWYARNVDGTVGIVPVLYLTPMQDSTDASGTPSKQAGASNQQKDAPRDPSPPPSVPKRLPSKAIVTKARISNPYDKTQLTLHEGDIVLVTKMLANGQWHGECKGKTGMFPYRHVTFLDEM